MAAGPSSHNVFFCFEGNVYDRIETPNRAPFDHAPSARELVHVLKKSFCIHGTIALRVGTQIYDEESDALLPVNDRGNVVFVSVTDSPAHAPEPQDLESWLRQEGVHPDTIKVLKDNNVNLENIREVTDELLVKMGLQHWETRVQILEAVKKYDVTPSVESVAIPTIPSIEAVTETPPPKRKREEVVSIPYPQSGSPTQAGSTALTIATEGGSTENTPTKKLKLGRLKKPKIKFKDVDVLINDERMPVHIGTTVYCGTVASNSGSNGTGTVVQHKDKAVVEYTIANEVRHGSLAKFYKDVTGDPLQEKGESWNNVFFKDHITGSVHSLEGLKYILNGPKKPVSAFLYFSNEARIKHKDLKPDTFARLAGELWKKLTPEEKQPYRILELQDKERFAKERQQWEQILSKAAPVPLPLPQILDALPPAAGTPNEPTLHVQEHVHPQVVNVV